MAQALTRGGRAPAFASRWTPVDGLPLHARTSSGQTAGGHPVVFVHGLGAASEAQLPAARLAAARWPVHVPDLPGFGRSPGPGHTLDVDALADRLAAWAEAVDLPPAAFIGNSAGCQVLAALAQRHPQRVDRLVLQGPTVDPEQRSAVRQIARFVLDGPVERPSLGLVQVRGARQAGLRRLLGTLRVILADAIEQRLPELTCPVLVVRGTRDPLVPARWAAEAARLAPRGQLRSVRGAPHCMVYSAPRELLGAAAPFLSR
jgi:2-hydroxy-6-oxonona-2,4-dienedioate hydrolase